jgi:hypothetical protein
MGKYQMSGDSWAEIFLEGWSHPPSRILKATQTCRRMEWPLNKRMHSKVTKLENKHRFAQEMPLVT